MPALGTREGGGWVRGWMRGAVGLWWGAKREPRGTYGEHECDILCGTFMASRTGETDTRVAALIAAGGIATGVATFVAVLVAQGVPPAVATLVARPVTGGQAGSCVAAGRNAAAMLARREVSRRRAGRGEQTSRSRSSSQTIPGAAADRVGRRLPTRSARGASRREMGAPSRWRWRALRR